MKPVATVSGESSSVQFKTCPFTWNASAYATLLEKHAQPREPGAVVELVPIDPERPGIRSGKCFDGSMRVSVRRASA